MMDEIKKTRHHQTMQNRLERTLTQEQTQLRNRLERLYFLTTDLMGIFGFDGYFKDINPAFETLLGFSRNELLSTPFINLVHPDDRTATLEAFAGLLEEKEAAGFENRFQCKDGGWKWLSWNANSDRDEELIYAVAVDITERKQAEEMLLASEAKYRNTLDAMLEGCQIIGFDWKYLYLNDIVVQQSHRLKCELLGKKYMDVWPGAEETASFTVLKRSLEDRLAQTIENQFTFLDGSLGWFELRIYPVPEGIVVFSVDITQHKLAEGKIKDVAKFPEENPNPVGRIQSDGRVIYANKACTPLLKQWNCQVGESLPPDLCQFVQSVFEKGNVLENEIAIDDETYLLLWVPVVGTNYVNAYGRNITKLKQADRALLKSQNLLNQTQQISKVGGWEYDLATQRVTWTDEVYHIYGVTKDYDPGSPKQDIQFYAPEDQKKIDEAFQRAVELGEPYDLELQFDNARGERLWIRTSGQAEREGGKIVSVFGNIMDVSGQKLAENEIIAEKELFRTTLASIEDAVVASDPAGNVTFLNPVAEMLTGWTSSKAKGHPIERVLPTINRFSRQPTKNPVDEVLRTGTSIAFADNFALATQDKRAIPIEFSASLIQNGRKVLGAVMVFHDITARRKTEEALRYQATLLDHLDVAVVASDDQYRITAWNREAEELYGWKAEEVLGKEGLGFTHTEFTGHDKAEMLARISEIGHWRGEGTQMNRIGRRFPVEISSIVLHDKDGRITDYLSINQDITERKQVQEALQIANAYNRSLIESSLDPMVTIGPDGKIMDVNRATETVTGVSRRQLIGDDFANYFTNNDDARDGYQKVLAEGLVRDYPLTIRHVSGKTTEVLYNAAVYKNKDGKIQGIFAAARDITERIQAENVLRQYSQRLAVINRLDQIISSSLDIVTAYDAFVLEMKDLVTFDRTSIIFLDEAGKNWQIFRQWTQGIPAFEPSVWFPLKGSSPEWIVQNRRAFLENQLGEKQDWPEHQGLRQEGIQSRILLPLFIQDKVIGMLTMASRQKEAYPAGDVELLQTLADQLAIAVQNNRLYGQARLTAEELERRVIERTTQLEQVNKDLESFSYSVSHDLRAPLRAINGFAQILARRHRAELDEEGQHYLDNVVEASTRMGVLIDDLLQYSRIGRSSIHRQTVPLHELFSQILGDLSSGVAETQAEVHLPPPGSMPAIQSDATLLSQIFSNIIDNALTYHRPGISPVIDITFKKERDHYLFGIADNGIGIPSEYLEKIFNVFQRLHSAEEYPGTGIGLAIVKKSAELLNGRVWAKSTESDGSTFWFEIPMEQK